MTRHSRLFIIVLMIAGTVSFSGLFAKTPKFALSIDFGPTLQTLFNEGGFGMGISFEFAVLERFSLVPQFSYSTYGTAETTTQIAPGAQLRMYPLSDAVSGFWTGVGFNYAILSRGSVSVSVSAVIIDIGYKWVLDGETGLFLEPYAGYGLIFAETRTIGNLDYGLSVGAAF